MAEAKNILISGSSRGLGREISRILTSLGHKVWTMGLSSPAEVDIRCDLLNLDLLKNEIHNCFDAIGPIDILICNAGTGKPPAGSYNSSELERYFLEKNLHTSQNLLFAAEPYLRSPGCSVIGISSIAALTDDSGAPEGYVKAKRLVNELFADKALLFAEIGVRVNIISPGNVFFEGSRWDEIRKEKPEFVKELLSERVPLHEFISPIEIVDAILFLSSKSATNITGTNLVIDGGQIL
jgi:NAD(P)-dependent dehydrogenase (short-subunit alcohol dehydrogenase family)